MFQPLPDRVGQVSIEASHVEDRHYWEMQGGSRKDRNYLLHVTMVMQGSCRAVCTDCE